MAGPLFKGAPAQRVAIRRARVGSFSFTEGMHAGDSFLPWHAHPVPTICLVLDGGFTEFASGEAVACEPATVKFMPAGEGHCDRFDHGPARGLMVEVDGGEVPTLGSYGSVLERRAHYQGGEVAGLAFRVHRELWNPDDAAPLALEGLMLELLASASRAQEPRGPRTAPWLTAARDLIEAELGTPLGVTRVALIVGVHPVTLARGFRRCFGCTMGEYVRRRRLERAMEQLRTSQIPLAAIAAANGFADQSHFSNLFRRRVGLSPSGYRRLVSC